MANGHNALEARDIDLLKQLFTQGMRQVSNLLSTLVHRKIQVVIAELTVINTNEINKRYTGQQPVVKFNVTNEVQGQGVLAFSQNTSLLLCGILMGREAGNLPTQMGGQELNVFSQLTGQFLNSMAASLAQLLGRKLAMGTSEAKISAIGNEVTGLSPSNGNTPWVVMTGKLVIEDSGEDQFVQVFPLPIAKEFVAMAQARGFKYSQRVEPLNLSPLDKSGKPVGATGIGNILVDIPLNLSVELGRAKMTIRDILELGVGSIIELERLAGEPVDIILNNKLLAKGEVVVIDDNLGVRLTDIINHGERI